MPAILAAILGSLGRFFTDKLAYFIAVKGLIILALVVVLPLVLKNLLNWFVNSVYSVVSSHVQSGQLDRVVLEFTGLGAYLAGAMQFPLVLSILLTAVTIRFTLNLIPFIK